MHVGALAVPFSADGTDGGTGVRRYMGWLLAVVVFLAGMGQVAPAMAAPPSAAKTTHRAHTQPPRPHRVVRLPASVRAKRARGPQEPHRPATKTQVTAATSGTATAGAASPQAAAAAPTPSAPFNECPAVGYDTSCGMLVNVTGSQIQILQDSSQGAFDGGDDTLIGVVNNSGTTVNSVSLSANTDAFGFDGDGLCSGYSPGPTDCYGPTGYEGPNTGFSNVSTDARSGTITFTGGLAPGDTAYFALEEALDPTTVFTSGPTVPEAGGAPNPSEKITTCYAKLPINCATGAFVHQFTDLTVPGRGAALSLGRSYSSTQAAADGPMGYGWSTSYAMSAATDGSGNVTITQEDGSTIGFLLSSGTFTAPPRVLASLVQNADGSYTMTRRPSQIAYTFSSTGQLLSESDRNGEVTTLSYSGSQLQRVTDPAGRSLTFTYSGSRIASVSDPMGRTWTYGYDAGGNLVHATEPVTSRVWGFTYDSNHLLLTMTDPAGSTVTNVYDGSSRVTSQTHTVRTGSDLTTTWAYSGDPASAGGGTTTMTDEHGDVTQYEYANLELLAVTHGFGTAAAATTSYTYDPATLGRATVTDPQGYVTTNSFDGDGNLTYSTDPLNNTTYRGYDSMDDLTYLESADGYWTYLGYDTAGNLVSVQDPLGGTTTYDHADTSHPGDVTSVTDPDGRVVGYGYDRQGDRTSATLSPSSGVTDVTQTVFDADGEPVCNATANAHALGTSCPEAGGARVAGTTTTTYDADGEPVQVTDAKGGVTGTGYAADGTVASITDPKGNVTRKTFDGLGRLLQLVAGANGGTPSTTNYAYDLASGAGTCSSSVAGASYCATTTDPNGHVTVDYYSPRDQLVQETRPGNHVTGHSYDISGNEVARTDAAGRVTNLGYDGDNRLVSVGYSNGSTPAVRYGYDVNGRRTSMDDGTGTSSWTYDAEGRLLSTTDGAHATVGYTYDGAGDVTDISYPTNGSVARVFDAARRLTSVTDWSGRVSSFRYDADGNLITTILPNGDTIASTFDATDAMTGTRTAPTATPASPQAAIGYTRDADGQITQESDSGTLTGTTAYTYNAQNQLTGANSSAYSYDAAGNPTRYGTATQAFDSADELTAATTSGGTAGFGYDQLGERTSSTPASGGPTHYVYDQAGRMTAATGTGTRPLVAAVSPTAGPTTGGGTVTITGAGFTGATAVNFGARTATFRVVSDTTITATLPAGSGVVDVKVTTPGGPSAASTADHFTYTSTPVVYTVAPRYGSTAGANTVTLTGANFTGATSVHFGARLAGHLSVRSSTSLTVTAPAGTGTVHVTVTTPKGTSAASNVDHYVYTVAPMVTGISQVRGPVAGGNTLTLSGNAFAGVTAVHFGSKAATGVRFVSSISLTVAVPSGSGTVDVTVTTSKGTSLKTTADRYTYTTAPVVSAVSPTAGSSSGRATVTISGFNLTKPTAVHFGSAAALSFAAGSATSMTAKAPPGSGTADVTVTTAAGTSAVGSTDRFTYLAAASISLASFTYNGDGLRTSRTVGTVSRHFAWDTTGTVPQLLTDGVTVILYGPDGSPLEQATSAATPSWFFHDALGSTRALLALTGGVTGSFTYNAYGAMVSHTGTVGTNQLYAGGYLDTQTGLYYLVHRYYDPATGQFMTLDPALGQTAEPYRYADDDPTDIVDPSGEFALVALGAIIGGAVGGVVSGVTYGLTCSASEYGCSVRGAAAATAGGIVGGAITGACDGGTLAVTACGAVGGVAGELVNEAIAGHGFDPTAVLTAGAFGAAGGFMAGKIVPPRGFKPYKLNNLWHPGKNTLRLWGDTALGSGLTGEGQALVGTVMANC